MKAKHNWSEIQTFYNSGHTIQETANKFGILKQNLSNSKYFKARPFSEQKAMAVATRKLKNNYGHSEQTKAKLSKIASDRGFGGKNYRKTFKYKNVTLESSYELRLAENLDKNKVNWQRPKRFYWIDSTGKRRHYTPDFYLLDYNVYLDPKNDYLMIQDKEKIETCAFQNNIKVYVLSKNQLSWEDVKKIINL